MESSDSDSCNNPNPHPLRASPKDAKMPRLIAPP